MKSSHQSKPDFYHYRDCTATSKDPQCHQSKSKEHFDFLQLPSDSTKKWYIAILILAIITLIFGCYCAKQ
jgi:hypothetical protein